MKKDTTKHPDLTQISRNAREKEELFFRYQPQISLVSGGMIKDLFLRYQPQISFVTGGVVAAEALVSWDYLEAGLHTADSFFLLAEEADLIVPIGGWAIEEACRQIKSWQEQGLRPPCISINISLRQFERGNVAQTITGALKSSGVSPALIGVEIKENTFTDGSARVFDALRELNALGVNIALDHFGTGYSSFADFKNNSLIEELKIDKFFVSNIACNPDDAAIVSSIIAMAQRLGLVVVAEGVETWEQVNTLKRLGCDIGQGSYFSKPLHAKEMVVFLAGQRSLFD